MILTATRDFVARSFAEGEVAEAGTEITRLMTKKPSRFAPEGAYADMKARVIEKLKAFFERFEDVSKNTVEPYGPGGNAVEI